MNVKCVECKKKLNEEEIECFGYNCGYCKKIYLCEDCGKNDEILYYHFDEDCIWHTNICNPCRKDHRYL